MRRALSWTLGSTRNQGAYVLITGNVPQALSTAQAPKETLHVIIPFNLQADTVKPIVESLCFTVKNTVANQDQRTPPYSLARCPASTSVSLSVSLGTDGSVPPHPELSKEWTRWMVSGHVFLMEIPHVLKFFPTQELVIITMKRDAVLESLLCERLRAKYFTFII